MTKADKKFHKVIKEFYNNKLKSSSNKKITDEKQAIAIAFSEARKEDKNYRIKKYETGSKIKLDNTTQLVFEEAWQKYLNFLSSSEKELSFDQWLQRNEEGLKYNKRLAQIMRSEVHAMNEPVYNERGSKVSNNEDHKGGKVSGKYHYEGGVKAIIKETERPVEIENEELIITKGVAQSNDVVTCEGHPEGIASRLNEMYKGDKISDQQATCHLKKEIMKKGTKIKSHLNENKNKKIERMVIRDNELKKQKMQEGSKIDENIYFKINEPKEFEILEFLSDAPFRMQKSLKTNDILIMKKSDELERFLDKYGIHYVEFESKTEIDEWLRNQLPKRIQNKIK